MIDKVQEIRKGIEILKSQLIKGACASQVAMETRCKEEAYNEVLAILDTMQEKPTSWIEEFKAKVDSMSKEDFKKIFDKYAIDFDEEPVSEVLLCAADSNSYKYIESVRGAAIQAFEDGANWKEQRMMEKAIDAELCSDGMFTPLISVNDKEKISDIKFGDKVKVILLKK